MTPRRALVVVAFVVALVVGWAVWSREAPGTLSNGCEYSARGIPACGAYVGAAVGGNDDPATLEDRVGALGVRRTYWRADQRGEAVDTARSDLAAGRLPWISFKLQVPWEEAAVGARDEWTRALADGLADLPGPVWVALHHEPEGDGDIAAWRTVQERLGPVLRERAPNVGFTVVLTGWNQVNGPPAYALDRIWPRTTVDVAGFDVYQMYGVERGGTRVEEVTDLPREYFAPFSAWAREKGVRWAVAETGTTDTAADERPALLGETYAALVDAGGVAFTYFDSPLNSIADWTLRTETKQEQFAEVLARSPRLPDLR
ncbi:hypothetical protein KC207_10320 [Phycicoccus sp. BSK3Z-2]|uniref:GH26 domain-containing protein n=1 Tax=Phycicoccus avicenniae TaxID=2828860 RepID=A0A941D8B1_9MICO|nr:hypothetical protein [Phycicoccus avicenniae]MBR7743683.1 hypothetical protein [Phycicoccus avicenniae]